MKQIMIAALGAAALTFGLGAAPASAQWGHHHHGHRHHGGHGYVGGHHHHHVHRHCRMVPRHFHDAYGHGYDRWVRVCHNHYH